MNEIKVLKGIFKIEKVPTAVKDRLCQQVWHKNYLDTHIEDRNYIDDLLYLAWLYAHEFLVCSEKSVDNEYLISLNIEDEKATKCLSGKIEIVTMAHVDNLHDYFNGFSTLYSESDFGDFSDIYKDFALITYKEEMLKILPEKVTEEDILKKLTRNNLCSLITHFNQRYTCKLLGPNEVIAICIAWLQYHGFLMPLENGLSQVDPELAKLDVSLYHPLGSFDAVLKNGFDLDGFSAHYDLPGIVQIAGWDTPAKAYYLKHHLTKN